jgi:hypothetical protein
MLKIDTPLIDDKDPLLPPADCVSDLRKVGLRMSPSWFEKLCKAGQGPSIDCYWGRAPMRKRSTLRKWAEERMQRETQKRLRQPGDRAA